jgi:hypothetical protein
MSPLQACKSSIIESRVLQLGSYFLLIRLNDDQLPTANCFLQLDLQVSQFYQEGILTQFTIRVNLRFSPEKNKSKFELESQSFLCILALVLDLSC